MRSLQRKAVFLIPIRQADAQTNAAAAMNLLKAVL
jgi:hypothetical protein